MKKSDKTTAAATTEEVDLKELFGDADALSKERPWYTSDIDDPVVGIAYILGRTTVGRGDEQRIVPSVVIRVLAKTRGMRNDEIVDVHPGEDIELVGNYAVSKRIVEMLKREPVVTFVRRGELRKHPTQSGKQLRDFEIQVFPLSLVKDSRYVTPKVRQDMNAAYKAMNQNREALALALGEATTAEGASAPF